MLSSFCWRGGGCILPSSKCISNKLLSEEVWGLSPPEASSARSQEEPVKAMLLFLEVKSKVVVGQETFAAGFENMQFVCLVAPAVLNVKSCPSFRFHLGQDCLSLTCAGYGLREGAHRSCLHGRDHTKVVL